MTVNVKADEKLALSVQLGAISLALRNVADQAMGARTTVIPRHLSASRYVIREPAAPQPAKLASAVSTAISRTMGVLPPARPQGAGNALE